jgi:hypothetical protein
MLRSTGVAVHSSRLVTDHGFDRMRQHELALAAPAVDVAAGL